MTKNPSDKGKEKIKLWLEILYWRLLRKSGIFNYWYKRHLIKDYHNMEIADIDQKYFMREIKEKIDKL